MIRTTRIFLKFFSHCLICSIVFAYHGGTALGQDQVVKENTVDTYTKHRQEFASKEKEIKIEFMAKKESLDKDISFTKQDISKLKTEIDKLESDITKKKLKTEILAKIQLFGSSILFPMVWGALMVPSLMSDTIYAFLYMFLVITILNVFIYIFRKQKIFYVKFKVALIVLLIILISSISSPLFAEDKNKQDQIDDQLIAVEKVLSLSDYERFIYILENRNEYTISVPELKSGDPLFKVYTRLDIDTPEYWETLAALYTHEGKNGKALNAVKQLIHRARTSNSPIHQEMIFNGIKYLIKQNQQELVNGIVESLSETNLGTSGFLTLANLLQENGLNVSSESIISFAIERADTVKSLVQLAEYLIKNGKIEKSAESIEKALEVSNSFQEVLLVADIAIARNQDNITKRLIEKSLYFSDNIEFIFNIIDLLQKNGRKEEAILVMGEMINRNTLNSQNSIEKQIKLIDGALQRGFIVQAARATELLYLQFGDDAVNYRFEPKNIPKAANDLPDKKDITLSQFYGLINEDQNLFDKAEDIYMDSISLSLSDILRSNGYNIPESLNDYYLLGRAWSRENENDRLDRLDAVYSIIEEKFIKQQNHFAERQIEEKNIELNILKGEQEELRKRLSEMSQKSKVETKKLIFQGLSSIATICFILATIIGCAVISYKYCKTLCFGQTFGFFTKFNETIGWLYVMTIISFFPGLISIIFAQFFQIFQQNQENTKRISQNLFLQSGAPTDNVS